MSDKRDFFISFNSADEAYAKAISDALRAAGFATFFHPDDLELGGHIPKWMNDALKNSRQMLALCSPAYMAGDAIFSEAERYARFWQDTRGEKFKLIPIVLKDVGFDPLLAVYKRLIVTNTTPADAAAAVVAALKKPEEVTERELLRDVQPIEQTRAAAYVHTTRLPETGYERLVGREVELRRLDEALVSAKTNIISLVAEGGAGKSALVNEWLGRLQQDSYPDCDLVLGWSFYSQGTERAASAEEFLNWALERLSVTLATTSATDKADAIAEVMMKRRVLLVLDGVEPLQHGPGPQVGQLKDLGLRALLRRLAATPPRAAHGLIVLTSRLSIRDIARWQDGPAPVVDIEQLSEEAGAALLSDNGIRGSDDELRTAARDFGGHPLALGLLASFLKETQTGDVRRRDHIRGLFADVGNPGHDHAARVMESYEAEWLTKEAVFLAIMHMIGLFDRPANDDCLEALRRPPIVQGLTNEIIKLDGAAWNRAVARLREVRLLAPLDVSAPDALDAHPLVREWFGDRFKEKNEEAWREAHGRLYEHLRDTTEEGESPTLKDLAPLYQAITPGCHARRHQLALGQIFLDRICRRRPDGALEFYSGFRLGALSSDLAAVSCFFERAFDKPVEFLDAGSRSWVLGEAAFDLRAQGRFMEALSALRASVELCQITKNWAEAANQTSNLSQSELLVGNVSAAVEAAVTSMALAERDGDSSIVAVGLLTRAYAALAAGGASDAQTLINDAEKRLSPGGRTIGLLDYVYCDSLLAQAQWRAAKERAEAALQATWRKISLLNDALNVLAFSRACMGLALDDSQKVPSSSDHGDVGLTFSFDQAVQGLRSAGQIGEVCVGLLARSRFYRNLGKWGSAMNDLDEVEEIAEPGPMLLHLSDVALERARLALAKIEAFAPLRGVLDKDNLTKEVFSGRREIAKLREEAAKQTRTANDYIQTCGYRLRDEEVAELQAVLRGEKKFAELPPRV